MKKVLLITTGLIALGMAPATAADLRKPYTKAPAAAVAINNWTGFYAGAMGGYAQENSSDAIGELSGGFAGGTLGYNWQSGQLVLGVETDAAWADVGATAAIPTLLSVSATVRSMGTVRGRIGYAFDQILVYGTGGYAWADARLSATAPAVGATIADSKLLSGWTIGAGVEVMFAPKWSVKAEYLYRSFEGQTYFSGIIPAGIPTGTLNLNSVQVGVNYHF